VFPPEPVVSALLSYDIAIELTRRKNYVVVVSPPPTRPYGLQSEEEKSERYPFEKVTLKSFTHAKSRLFGRIIENISFGSHCYQYIKKNREQIGVIYANTYPLFAQYLLSRAGRKYKIPIILHIQDIYPESFATKQPAVLKKFIICVFAKLDAFNLKRCAKIIAISLKMKEYLVRTRKISREKIFVVRNWQKEIKIMRFHHCNRDKRSGLVFMYLGSINPSASVETLIHAFGEAELPGCKLIIAGEGSNKASCKKEADTYPNKDIEFMPAPVERIYNIQEQADVLLLPLKKGIAMTATPSKLIAYMFSGKPIIACVENDSDTSDCILGARCGFVVEPENQAQLKDRMQKILTLESPLLEELGRNSFNYAIANLSREANLKRIIAVILGEVNGAEEISGP